MLTKFKTDWVLIQSDEQARKELRSAGLYGLLMEGIALYSLYAMDITSALTRVVAVTDWSVAKQVVIMGLMCVLLFLVVVVIPVGFIWVSLTHLARHVRSMNELKDFVDTQL